MESKKDPFVNAVETARALSSKNGLLYAVGKAGKAWRVAKAVHKNQIEKMSANGYVFPIDETGINQNREREILG